MAQEAGSSWWDGRSCSDDLPQIDGRKCRRLRTEFESSSSYPKLLPWLPQDVSGADSSVQAPQQVVVDGVRITTKGNEEQLAGSRPKVALKGDALVGEAIGQVTTKASEYQSALPCPRPSSLALDVHCCPWCLWQHGRGEKFFYLQVAFSGLEGPHKIRIGQGWNFPSTCSFSRVCSVSLGPAESGWWPGRCWILLGQFPYRMARGCC